MEPKFDNYNLSELEDILENMDKDKWPDRAQRVKSLIKEKQAFVSDENPIPILGVYADKTNAKKKPSLFIIIILALSILFTLSTGKVSVSSRHDGFSFEDSPIVFCSIEVSLIFFLYRLIKLRLQN
jgi:hypothetical protein